MRDQPRCGAWGLLERHAIDVNSAVGASGSVDDYNVRNTFVLYGGVGGGASGANVPTQLRRTDQDLYRAATLVQGVDMLYLNASGSAALMDDDLGRVTQMKFPGSTLIQAEYRYLGVGTVIETDVAAALMRSRLHTGDSPAAYTNKLDRWNRPVREHWQTYDAGAATLVDFVDVAVTLNAAGSTLKRDGVYYPIEDAKGTYDNLGRLTSLRHGTLDGSGDIPIADGRREDVRTFTQAGTVAAWDMDLNFQFDGTTAFAPNYTDLEETKDTRTLNLLDKPTARDTNSDNGAQPEYTIAYDKLTRPTSDGLNYEWVYDGFGRLAQAKVKTGGALVKEFAYDGLGRVIGERYDTDATAGVGTVAQDPWYFKAYDGFSRHVATFRGADASPKEIYTHHEMGSGGSQLAVRRDVDATGGGGWGGSSDGVLETQAHLLHRANGDVIAAVGGLKDTGSVTRPGAVRERMEFVPGGDGAGSVEPMRLSPSDGYQIGGARGADGLVTGDDYNAFIAEYVAGTANGATDLNNNGVVDGDDFTAWNAEWDSGALVGRAIMSVPDGADAKGPGNVRGAMAAAGLALDAVLSGKVSGTSGQTGRVRWGGGPRAAGALAVGYPPFIQGAGAGRMAINRLRGSHGGEERPLGPPIAPFTDIPWERDRGNNNEGLPLAPYRKWDGDRWLHPDDQNSVGPFTEVCCRYLGAGPSSPAQAFDHCYITVFDGANRTGFSGTGYASPKDPSAPEEGCNQALPPPGRIGGLSDPYDRSFYDWPGSQDQAEWTTCRRFSITDVEAVRQRACMEQVLSQLKRCCLPYLLFDDNSNSVAYTLWKRCGHVSLPGAPTRTSAPGWGTDLCGSRCACVVSQ
jgi:hypothetical protein